MKRALLIGGGIAAVAAAAWFFFLKNKLNPPANDTKPASQGISLSAFDPTSKNAAFGNLTRAGIKLFGDKLDSWLT